MAQRQLTIELGGLMGRLRQHQKRQQDKFGVQDVLAKEHTEGAAAAEAADVQDKSLLCASAAAAVRVGGCSQDVVKDACTSAAFRIRCPVFTNSDVTLRLSLALVSMNVMLCASARLCASAGATSPGPKSSLVLTCTTSITQACGPGCSVKVPTSRLHTQLAARCVSMLKTLCMLPS